MVFSSSLLLLNYIKTGGKSKVFYHLHVEGGASSGGGEIVAGHEGVAPGDNAAAGNLLPVEALADPRGVAAAQSTQISRAVFVFIVFSSV